MVNELKDILERLHKVFWNNRNGQYRNTLMPISFACNLIYLVIRELEEVNLLTQIKEKEGDCVATRK